MTTYNKGRGKQFLYHKQIHVGTDPRDGRRVREWIHADSLNELEEKINKRKAEFQTQVDKYKEIKKSTDLPDIKPKRKAGEDLLKEKIINYEIAKEFIKKDLQELEQVYKAAEVFISEYKGFVEQTRYILEDLLDLKEESEYSINKGKSNDAACYVYYILNGDKDCVKIGISNNPERRAKNIQTSSGQDIEILNVIGFDSREKAEEAEKLLHKAFGDYRRKPSKVAKRSEWFDADILPMLLKVDSAEVIEQMKEGLCEVDPEILAHKEEQWKDYGKGVSSYFKHLYEVNVERNQLRKVINHL